VVSCPVDNKTEIKFLIFLKEFRQTNTDNKRVNIRYDVLVVAIKMTVFCIMTPDNLLEAYQRFGVACCLVSSFH